jgi:hypothetical protein
MDFDQGILHRIGCGFLGAENLLSQALRGCLIVANEVVEGSVIAAAGGFDQFGHLHYGCAH